MSLDSSMWVWNVWLENGCNIHEFGRWDGILADLQGIFFITTHLSGSHLFLFLHLFLHLHKMESQAWKKLWTLLFLALNHQQMITYKPVISQEKRTRLCFLTHLLPVSHKLLWKLETSAIPFWVVRKECGVPVVSVGSHFCDFFFFAVPWNYLLSLWLLSCSL